MKKSKILLVLLLLAVSLPTIAVKREQRAIWMSAYVADWPNSKVTEQNANRHKQICRNNLDTIQRNNYTTIYYHVRTMCDAMYDSKYEPWSSYLTGSRGQKPAFDPLRYILDESHKRGIEVYAWMNPYRYLNSKFTESWGGDPKNYENSHPDWLIKWNNGERTWTILNPALKEVKQRIIDVVADLLSKYDVDGVVFDDYFYQDGLPLDMDEKWYQEYVAAGGKMGQKDWRRENVNSMVRELNAYIKATKPWVRFGIGPAGVAGSKKEVADKYGVRPSPGYDWQYNGIYSDPLNWLYEGSIDFISPQVYWTIGTPSADYGLITPWWYEVSKKFNRHCYISQTLSNFEGGGFSELVEETELNRASALDDAPGTVYFPWKYITSLRDYWNDKKIYLSPYMRMNCFHTRALTPAATWVPAANPGQVSNVKRSGRTISWNGPENVRFSVYAVPNNVSLSGFHKESEYLRGISYGKSFDIPQFEKNYPEFGIADSDLGNYKYAVAVLDRYGNEYAPVFVDANVEDAQKPVVAYPAKNEKTAPVFDFKWNGNATMYEICVSEDAEMKTVVARKEVAANFITSTEVCDFQVDKTYYFSVVARDNNKREVRSEIIPFSVNVFHVIAPANNLEGCSLTPTIEWSNVGEGASYEMTISEDVNFVKPLIVEKTKATSYAVPEFKLSGNKDYYLKVVSQAGPLTFETKQVLFTTKGIVADVPVFVRPTVEGATLYADQKIEVSPVAGISATKIMIAASTSFSPRASYSGTFENFVFATPELSTVKVGTKLMEDGKTYYTRARFSYYDEAKKTVETEWSQPVSFVYSKNAGVNDLLSEGVAITVVDDEVRINQVAEVVEVFNAAGEIVASANNAASVKVPANGVMIVKASIDGKLNVKKVVL